ncbi:hypothetical protein A0257_08650 [Hymenobacter psoromatis]|nr:hypothetical protein A0257_08650 [Hymenobacter psoromatis]
MLAGLVACQSENKPATPLATVQVRDDLGRELTLPAHPRRVLALAPSLTEMLYAVADTATIIARTQADDYPAAALRKPLVSSYPLDLERLVALRPDVVFTVEGMTPPDAAARLGQLGIPVYYQKYRRVADVLRGLNDLGRLLGRPAQARHLTDSLQAQLDQLAAGPTPPPAGPRCWPWPRPTRFMPTVRTRCSRTRFGWRAGKMRCAIPSRSPFRPSRGSIF